MSEHHCWYVIGRNLRLALAYAFFASLVIVHPASAVEDTDLTAQKTTISNGQVTAKSIAETVAIEPAAGEEVFVSTIEEDGAERFVLSDTGETYELVLELVRRSDSLSSVVIGLERGFEYYLPIGELARILKFPSEIDVAAQRIEGVFFNSANLYSLDVKAGTYTVNGETFPVPPDSIIMRGPDEEFPDIYVKPELLNQIWPLELDVDFSRQVISINTRRKLPYELERLRKKQQEQLERERDKGDEIAAKYNYVANGYRWLGPHVLSLSHSTDWNNDEKDLINNFYLSGNGDLLGASANYSVTAQQGVEESPIITDFRLKLSRQDYDSGQLLPFGLKLAEVGDLSVFTPSLVGGAQSGRGVFLSTSTRNRNQEFDEVTVEGDAQPGWEVEIYRGPVLIDFGLVDESGRYRFENVPLNFGRNEIRIVLYGPQGQIEERVEDYKIERSFLRPGEMSYEGGIVQTGKRFIEIDKDRSSEGEFARQFRVNRGISHWMSGYATFTDIPGRAADRLKYVSLGADFNAFEGAGQVEAYKQLDGGTALDFAFARKFLGISTSFKTSLFRDFESPRAGFGDVAKEHETSLRASKNFTTPFGGLQLNFSTRHTQFKNDRNVTSLSTGQNLSASYFNTSNSTTTSYQNGEHIKSSGKLALNRALSERMRLGSTLSYELYPESKFDSAELSLSYSDLDKFTASASIGQGLQDTSQRSATLGASYDFGKFFGNLSLDWNKNDGVDVTVSTRTVLGPQGPDNAYEFINRYKGQQTALRIQLYEDLDGNGEFNDTDSPVENAHVLLNGGNRSKGSDEQGFIEMLGAGREGLTTVTLDRKTLHNPFLVSAKKEGYVTVLRSGTKPFINFPLIMTGSIDGTVRDVDGTSMPGLIMQLIDQHGQLVAEAPTLSDGFYVFELVRPGRYIVQVHPSHPVFVPTQTVVVASDDLFAYGVDLQVLEQAAEASVAENGEGRVAHTYQAPVTGGTEMPVSTLSGNGVQSVIRAVRIGEYSDKTRLVLDLSDPISYQVTREKAGNAIYVDLPGAVTDVISADWNAGKHTLFSTIEIHELPEGGTQIKLNANAPLAVRESKLLDPAPEAGKGHRLFIDFTKAK